MAPSGARGVANDALAVHFLDAALAGAFVARWCAERKAEVTDGLLKVRETSQRRALEPLTTARHPERKVAGVKGAPGRCRFSAPHLLRKAIPSCLRALRRRCVDPQQAFMFQLRPECLRNRVTECGNVLPNVFW